MIKSLLTILGKGSLAYFCLFCAIWIFVGILSIYDIFSIGDILIQISTISLLATALSYLIFFISNLILEERYGHGAIIKK